ncbi:uncharacterized protein (TIGR03083 family) [Streptomyces sp. V4I8]|uniref:maleylpyruvate isomerase family mycothiol-dependent enzyme n=1 Tax=Streptomyces sp. V4I8 TaxID=3156469 RepID=UPI00351907EC
MAARIMGGPDASGEQFLRQLAESSANSWPRPPSPAGLEASWARATDVDWSRPVTFRNSDLAATVFARWREAWIHMVDLELGVRPDDWPGVLAAHAIDFLLGRRPAGTRVRAEDVGRQWSVGDGPPGTVVTGGVRDLAAWLAGRTPVVSPVAAEELPALGPWPPHPPQRLDRL